MSRSILQYFTEQDNTDSTIPDPQEEKKGFISRTISSFLKKAPEVAKDAMKKTGLVKR